METLLLIISIVLLLVDLDEHRTCHAAATVDERTWAGRRAWTTEHQIEHLTAQSVQDMLAEARRWEPGGGP